LLRHSVLPDVAAHPLLEGPAGTGGLQGVRRAEILGAVLWLLVREGAAGAARQGQPHLWDRPGVLDLVERSVLQRPHLLERLWRRDRGARRQASHRRTRREEEGDPGGRQLRQADQVAVLAARRRQLE